MRQIHTDARPESEAERRYWRRMDLLRFAGQSLVGVLGAVTMLVLLFALVFGVFFPTC